MIRIGTRVPVTLPQKLYDQELIDLLASAEKVWIQTHFNHPREITPEAARVCNAACCGPACRSTTTRCCSRASTTTWQTMRKLMRALLRIKVRPYYLFHCDPVIGAGHFRTSVWKGLEIMEGLRGHMSGLAIPTYVVDSPHGGGKIPLMPNYLVSASDDCVVLRNYEGMLVRYQAEDKPITVQPTATRGVSQLVAGHQVRPDAGEQRPHGPAAAAIKNGRKWKRAVRAAAISVRTTMACRSRTSAKDSWPHCPSWQSS